MKNSSYLQKIEIIKNKVLNFQEREITAYIHCSKLNDCWLALKQVPALLDQFNQKGTNTQFTSIIHAFDSLISIVEQLEDLFLQCSRDMCVQFLLSTPVSVPKTEISMLRDAAASAFHQLGILQGEELFRLSKDELELQESVDMKRISQVLIHISLKGRDDIKKSLDLRFNSLKRLGISISKEDITDLTVPELPPNLRTVMKHEEIELGKQIGNGQSGVVKIGKIIKTGEIVAVKILHRRALTSPELESFRREIYSLSVLIHPSLIDFKGYTEESPFYIVTEYMENGSLFDVLRKNPKALTPTLRSLIAYDVALGIEYLHDRKIIHRDLKSLNILLDGNYKAKISDFGMVRTKTQGPMTGLIGTAHWMAPEVLMSSPYYNEKVDVFSYGILLWELLTGDMPYKNMSPGNITIGVIQGTLRPPLPSDTPPKLAELIQKCWNQDPTKRPSMKRVVSYLKNARYHFEGTDENEFNQKAGIVTHKKRHRSKVTKMLEPEELVAKFKNRDQTDSTESDDQSESGIVFSNGQLIEILNETLLKRASASAFAKAGGCPILIEIINRRNDDSETVMKRLSQCKSSKVFDVDVLLALLSCSNSNDPKIRRRAVQALVNSSDLRFNFIASSPSFLIQLLQFMRKDIQYDTAKSLLQLTQKILSSIQQLPDGLIQLLFDIRRFWKQQDKNIYDDINNCFLTALQFQSAKEKFTKDNFIELLSSFGQSVNILNAYCEGIDPQQPDPIFISLLHGLQKTPEICNFFATIAQNPRFSRHVVMCLPFNQPPSAICNIYTALLNDPNIDTRIFSHEEFYKVSEYLISHKRYDEVCSALKVCTPDSDLLLKSNLCQVLSDEFMNENDDEINNLVILMAAIFSTARVARIHCYKKIIPRLSSFLVSGNQSLSMPSFLCLSALAFQSKEGINMQNLLSAAAFYVTFDSLLMRGISAKVIQQFINEKGIHISKIVSIFLENFKATDNNAKIAATSLLNACRSHKDIDSSMKQRLTHISSR
ncbi:hypothetical protein M9Y10_002517 [Tritrichomonas musculus]|uniref:Protein kinase domain-containing protein n=1 Tax=Tritrichomonas musculus TaxID=1915356 RepID=A0ABR2LA31_9EUKA